MTNQMSLSSLNQKQKAFITSRNLSIGITWIFENKFILNQYQNHFCDWNNLEVPKILHENISLYKKPKLTFTYPHPKLNPSWTLGGHDQAGGQSKTHGRAGSMIPVLRKMSGKIGNSWDKGWRTKMYDDIKPFPEVKITRCNPSKQKWKSHRSLLPTLQLLRENKDTMKKWGPIFLR